MNGKQAKRIRRQVYGDDFSPKFREYRGENRQRFRGIRDVLTVVNQVGTVTADFRRQAYQKAKRDYTRGVK